MAVETKPDHFEWEQIYDSYFPLLFRYSFRFTSEYETVKDVLQDLFLDLYLKRESADPVRNLRSYLLVCTRRRLLKKLKSDSERRMIPLSEESHDFRLELSPETAMVDRETLESRSNHLKIAINSLSKRQKEAVYLRFYENLSYQEIAEILGMKDVKYARTLVYRAISEMKAALKKSGILICLAIVLSGGHPKPFPDTRRSFFDFF